MYTPVSFRLLYLTLGECVVFIFHLHSYCSCSWQWFGGGGAGSCTGGMPHQKGMGGRLQAGGGGGEAGWRGFDFLRTPQDWANGQNSHDSDSTTKKFMTTGKILRNCAVLKK